MATRYPQALLMVLFVLSAAFSSLHCANVDSAEGDIQGQLKGSWTSKCMDVGSGVYIKTTSTFDGAGQVTDEVVFYSDSACTHPTKMVKTDTATYKIGKSLDVEGMTAYEMDLTIKEWSLKQYGNTLKSGGEVPTQYDIVAIESDKLYTSGLTRKDKGPIVDPARRPTTLDKQNFFTKE